MENTKIKMSEAIQNKKQLKKLRIVSMIFIMAFFIFFVKNCNNSMELESVKQTNYELVDSIETMYGSEKEELVYKLNNALDSIQSLNYELKIAIKEKESAERQVEAVQNTVERINRNTTIRIENRSERDSMLIENK